MKTAKEWGFIILMMIALTGLASCTRSIKADAIDQANIATAQAMSAKYSQTIEACKFKALPGQSINISGVSEFSCNYEAKPLAYIQKQHVQTEGEKLANTLLGIAQIAAPIVGQAINTRAMFRGLTDLTSVIVGGVGHNSSTVITGSNNADRHDSTTPTTITGSTIDSFNGDNRDNRPVSTIDSHAVDSHAVDRHDVVTPAPVVITPTVITPTVIPPVFAPVPVVAP